MKELHLFLSIILTTINSFSQTDLKSLFTEADSIVIIHHNTPMHLKPPTYPPAKNTYTATDSLKTNLFMSGSLNQLLIINKLSLNEQQRNELTSIFTKAYNNKIITSLCWEPMHTIEIFSKVHHSYVTLCFHCYGYIFTDQTSSRIAYLPEDMWSALKDYFIRNVIFE